PSRFEALVSWRWIRIPRPSWSAAAMSSRPPSACAARPMSRRARKTFSSTCARWIPRNCKPARRPASSHLPGEPTPMTKPINSALILTIALPLFAIGASVGIAVVAFTRGDPTLPDEYHWEGMSLDRDFADSRRAADLNVHATVQTLPATGTCRVTLQLDGALPPDLTLKLVHAT